MEPRTVYRAAIWSLAQLALILLAGPKADAKCVSTAQIQQLGGALQCRNLGKLSVSLKEMPNNCHSQGLAVDSSVTVSCMDRSDSSAAYMVVFPRPGDTGKAFKYKVGNSYRHPSAFQFLGDKTAVAFAPNSPNGQSQIRFFDLKNQELVPAEDATIMAPTHIGALAFGRVGELETLIGCAWDCNDWAVWTRKAGSRAFTATSVRKPKEHTDHRGLDSGVGAYNSLFLTTRCEDKQPLLFASHGTWLDVWELSGVGTADLRLKKIMKRNFKSVFHPGINLFHEGMTLFWNGGQLEIMAAPHDFKTEGCGPGLRCTPGLYSCTAAGGAKAGPGAN
ncbi:MAG TPA: hypothetical protein VFV50_19005 [Bdellovibrionales bacterium]|nr:hypothetical protein [Bdellovibrionales bacterium]